MRRIQAREEVCIGCRLCEVHCLVAHSPTRDLVRAYRQEKARALPRVQVQEEGAVSFALQCRHCREPLCAYACLTGAMQRDEQTGMVAFEPERCIGCWTCILVCPHGALQRDPNRLRVAPKCDLCAGREMPACVANCPNEALILVEEAH